MILFRPFLFTRLWLMALILLFAGRAMAAAGDIDAAFNIGTGASGSISALAVQADGKVVIGGNFTSVNGVTRLGIARLNADGSLDTGFNPSASASGPVNMALQSDGKIVIGGYFTTVNGIARKGIARLNADGSLDTGFDPGIGMDGTTDYTVYGVALQSDGKVLVGGFFTSVNGVTRNRIARLNTDGSLDAGFNPGADAQVLALAVQADGKVLMGGYFAAVNGVARKGLARLNTDGSLDVGYNPSTTTGEVFSLVIQPDGKVLVGGNSYYYMNGVPHFTRLNADGSLDAGFIPGADANRTVRKVVLQADGKVLISGDFTVVNGIARNRIARLNADGSLDTGFNPVSGADGIVFNLALQRDGRLILGGNFTQYNGAAVGHIVRVHSGDTDADGVEDAADYFSANPVAVADTDHDGLPDAWLQPNAFGCMPDAATCNGLTRDLEPSNAVNGSVLPLNNLYRGSTVYERNNVQ